MKRFILTLSFSALATIGSFSGHGCHAQTAIDEIPLDPTKQSVASQWVSEALLAVSDPAGQSLGPTAASRAYGMLGTTMYDAWSAYESTPISTVLGDTLQQTAASNTTANKQSAMRHIRFCLTSSPIPICKTLSDHA